MVWPPTPGTDARRKADGFSCAGYRRHDGGAAGGNLALKVLLIVTNSIKLQVKTKQTLPTNSSQIN